MKKIKRYGILFLFSIISMYITNSWIGELNKNDSILKQIETSKSILEIEPVNAVVEENEIIPGKVGKEIDVEQSYRNMKAYGTYNEALTVLKEKEPEISLKNKWDKVITKGRDDKRKIALIFPIDNKKDIIRILSFLKTKEVEGTFFLEGNILEEITPILKKNTNHEYEILSYNHHYNSSFLTSSRDYLQAITGFQTKYCYNEQKEESFQKDCIKNKLYTIEPTKIKKDLLKTTKKTIENGCLLSIEWNEETEKEFTTTIDYIKSKGYQIVLLKELLSEKEE